MKRIILHAGTHKTGTSALQLFAHENTTVLRDFGIYYPLAARSYSAPDRPDPTHHLLPWSLEGRYVGTSVWPDDNHSPERVWGALLDEIRARPEPTILLSSEDFSGLQAEHLQMIPSLLDEFEVVPIIYFRRFDEYIQALYMHEVLFKQPPERDRIKFYAQRVAAWADYTRRVSMWRSVFGDSLIVKPFYRSTLVSQSIVCDLFATLGYRVDAARLNRYSYTNSSIPWNMVECARLLNKLGVSFPSRRYWNFCGWLYRGKVSHDLLPPSQRGQLIQTSLPFFERECGDILDAQFWQHMRGDDLPTSDEEWEATHRRYSFVARTVSDFFAARREILARYRLVGGFKFG